MLGSGHDGGVPSETPLPPAQCLARFGMLPDERVWLHAAQVRAAWLLRDPSGAAHSLRVIFADGRELDLPPGARVLTGTAYTIGLEGGTTTTPATDLATNCATISSPAVKTSTGPSTPSIINGLRSILSAFTRTLAPVFRKISKVFIPAQRALFSSLTQSQGWAVIRGVAAAVLVAIAFIVMVALATGCATPRPQQGGASTATLGGATAPTVVVTAAPENPQTPSTTAVEKTVVREFAAPALAPAPISDLPAPNSELRPSPVAVTPPALLREIITEKATTATGASQRDTARSLAQRFAATRGVMWAGLLLLIGGPIVALRMGWPLNGAIAAATGLLLIVLAQVLPGNEAWLGLGLLLLIPVVCYVYYRGHYDRPSASSS